MNRTALEQAAERFALGQWLSDYPDGWSYQTVIDCLKEDCQVGGGFIFEKDEDEDNPDTIFPWEAVENYSGEHIAEMIDDSRRAFIGHASDLLATQEN
ncbi:MAG: hypothetical protein ACK5SP_02250 [bacterium]|jgi:hypothetical protein